MENLEEIERSPDGRKRKANDEEDPFQPRAKRRRPNASLLGVHEHASILVVNSPSNCSNSPSKATLIGSESERKNGQFVFTKEYVSTVFERLRKRKNTLRHSSNIQGEPSASTVTNGSFSDLKAQAVDTDNASVASPSTSSMDGNTTASPVDENVSPSPTPSVDESDELPDWLRDSSSDTSSVDEREEPDWLSEAPVASPCWEELEVDKEGVGWLIEIPDLSSDEEEQEEKEEADMKHHQQRESSAPGPGEEKSEILSATGWKIKDEEPDWLVEMWQVKAGRRMKEEEPPYWGTAASRAQEKQETTSHNASCLKKHQDQL